MINAFTTPLAHTAPINNDKMSPPQIINSQESPQSSCPRKKGDPRWDLSLPNTFPWERIIRSHTHKTIILLDRKPFVRITPLAQLVFPFTSQRNGIN
jgi:hypothetical protein